MRNPGEAIDFEVPIKGDLRNPKFKLWPVISEVLKNIVIKPPTSPYLAHVKTVEQKVEKYHTIDWAMREAVYHNGQQKYVESIADFLKKEPTASITIKPVEYEEKEKEQILFFEAKKKFFFHVYKLKEFSQDDSIFVDKMSVKDSMFVRYLKKQVPDRMIFTVQERCKHLISNDVVEAKYKQLKTQRQEYFLAFFKDKGAERVKIGKSEDYVPYNGFSYYKVEYKNDIPDKLNKAYENIDELNAKAPRKKYLVERIRNRHATAGTRDTGGVRK